MAHRRTLSTLALATLAILPLGTIACSQGHSPTEPAPLSETNGALTAPSSGTLASVTSASKSHGADDTATDDRGGHGNGGKGGRGGKDDHPKAPQTGAQFTGAVTAVSSGRLTLAGGVKVTVSAQTQWNARGDLFSVSEIASSLSAHHAPRVEGRGARQADGSILAQSIKAEDNR